MRYMLKIVEADRSPIEHLYERSRSGMLCSIFRAKALAASSNDIPSVGKCIRWVHGPMISMGPCTQCVHFPHWEYTRAGCDFHSREQCFFWVFWEFGLLDFSLVEFLATPIFFKVKWEKLKMLTSMRELIQY
jgi:hypothetical protein